MGFTTFDRAKAFVERGYGECDQEVLAEVVNEIRSHWYNWYDELRLFIGAAQCFAVQHFCIDCNACNDSYRGITLPRDFQNIEAMWWNSWPIKLQSSWREFQVGMSHECDCGLEKYDVPGFFSTALDLNPRAPKRLKIKAFKASDAGKKIIIRGIDSVGRDVEETVTLTTAPHLTDLAFRSIGNDGAVRKEITVGRVIVSDEDDRMLAMYEPDETVPSYRRVKITGLMDNCQVVNIRAAKRYAPIYDDNDVVESDNTPAWDAMARYLRVYRKTEKSGSDLQNEKNFLATAVKMLIGEKARDTGKGTQAELRISTPSMSAPRLHRFG